MRGSTRIATVLATTSAILLLGAGPAFAQVEAANSGHTAWMLTATALVLLMTLPGLALFYGGLVRATNVLSVLTQCFAIACLASVLWFVALYSLAFGDGGYLNGLIGGLDKAFLAGVAVDDAADGIPETVFFTFQMTFAIITPALIVGAYVERIKFSAVLWFTGAWLVLVYAPVAHWVWGGGWMAEIGVMDFAGGLVVHLTCGVSALVAALMLGPRAGFPAELRPPHSPGLAMAGACMLWVGWFGFNAGSALAADGNAGMAMVVTHIAAASGALVWMAIEWSRHGRASLVGMITGMIAGLATITPASGFVGPAGGFVIGIAGGLLCYYLTLLVKQRLKIDDSLDVFAVHGVGGATGIVLVAFLAGPEFGGLGRALDSVGGQLGVQLIGLLGTAAWAAALSAAILWAIARTIGLRVNAEAESEGLDLTAHGERAYYF